MELPVVIAGPGALPELVGRTVGPTPWRRVTQSDIDTFADLSGDHQWIHVDPERAAVESPYGATVAHGNLTLAMIDGFRLQLLRVEGAALGINYGWNRVRFPAPVVAGARIRASAELLALDELEGGWLQSVTRFTIEADGQAKPACVAESVGRLLPAEA